MKDERLYVEHMLDCIERIARYTQEGKLAFYTSTLIQDAVVRNLQTMAESSQRIAEASKRQHPEIPWREIAGFRDILVHDYLGLDMDVVWSGGGTRFAAASGCAAKMG